MKKQILILGIAGIFFFPFSPEAQTEDFVPNELKTEVHIDKDGKVSINGAKVMQFAGATMYTRLIWGDAFVRLIVTTNDKTNIVRKYGEVIPVKDIKVSDRIYLTGVLQSGADSLTVNADFVKDLSDQNEQNQFNGKVLSVSTTTAGFSLTTKNQGNIFVAVSPDTQIILGSRTVDFKHIKEGNQILNVAGSFNHATKVMQSKNITVYIDGKIFEPRNFQGTLRSVSGTELPVVARISIEGKDYSVRIPAGAQILNKDRKTVFLSRFLNGDIVRLYGHIEEADDPVITADIVRNISL